MPYSPLTSEIDEVLLAELEAKVEHIIENYIHESWIETFEKSKAELVWALYKVREYRLAHPNARIFPLHESEWFTAFKNTALDAVIMVILGQDPYPGCDKDGEPFACGMAFSAHDGQGAPVSLENIYKRLRELHYTVSSADGYLGGWAAQGILLLNTSLTVEENKPASMMAPKNDVWTPFISNILQAIYSQDKSIQFLLWGRESQKYMAMSGLKCVGLEWGHPSRWENFRGCEHFTIVNQNFKEAKKKQIDWGKTRIVEEEE